MTFVAGTVLTAAALNSELAAKYDNAPAINAQTGTTYTFVLADATAGKTITASNAAASTYTVPPQSSVTFVAGALLRVTNLGAGVVTFAGGVGVTVTNTAATLSQYQTATLVRTGSDAWTVIRQGATAPGISLLGTASPSAVASVSINSVFSATYQNYLVLAAVSFASSDRPMLRLRASGTSSSANYSSYYTEITTAPATAVGFGASDKILAAQTASTGLCFISMTLCNVFAAAPTLFTVACVDGSSTPRSHFGRHTASTSYDGIELLSENGQNMTGSLRIYGYANS